MIYDVDKYVELLCKAQISTDQFLICTLIHLKDYKSMERYKAEYENFRVEHVRFQIRDLMDRGFIVPTRKGHYEIDELFVTPLFTALVFIDPEDSGTEIWEVYPKWLFLDNKKISAKSCDKDDLIERYNGKIKRNIIKHKKIISLIENFKSNNDYAEMGIEKFVASEHWELLEDLYKDKGGNFYGERIL